MMDLLTTEVNLRKIASNHDTTEDVVAKAQNFDSEFTYRAKTSLASGIAAIPSGLSLAELNDFVMASTNNN